MTGEKIRQCLSDESLVKLRSCILGRENIDECLSLMVGDYADIYGDQWASLSEASREIGRRANGLMRQKLLHEEAVKDLHENNIKSWADIFSQDAHRRSKALIKMNDIGKWPDPLVLGGLYIGQNVLDLRSSLHRILDGKLVSDSLAVASNEVLNRETLDTHQDILELKGLMPENHLALSHEWDKKLKDAERVFMRNGVVSGMSGLEAKAQALISGRMVHGDMLMEVGHYNDDEIFILAGAAMSSYSRKPGFELSDLEDRQLGAAAIGAAYGFSYGWKDLPEEQVSSAVVSSQSLEKTSGFEQDGEMTLMLHGIIPIKVSRSMLSDLSSLSINGALQLLEDKITDPMTPEEESSKYELLADALDLRSRGVSSKSVSLSRLLELEENPPELGELKEYEKLYEAVPVGSFPVIVSDVGDRGREVLARAMANNKGQLVGYRAYDVLSNEFEGKSLHLIYDLNGYCAGILENGRFIRELPKSRPRSALGKLQKIVDINEKKIAV